MKGRIFMAIEDNYIKNMLEDGSLAVIFPRDKSMKSAEKAVDLIDSAIGIAEFEDESGNSVYGVLIDKIKQIKNQYRLMEKSNGSSM